MLSAPPPALDPGGGVAIFPTSAASEEMASCVATVVQRRLPKMRIVSGSDARVLAFGPDAERSMQPPGPEPLRPDARERLQAAGISYTVMVYGGTSTSHGSGGPLDPALSPGLWGMAWTRESEALAAVYEAASGKEVTYVRSKAAGETGFFAYLFIPIVPVFARTESHACKAVGNDLADAFAGVKSRTE